MDIRKLEIGSGDLRTNGFLAIDKSLNSSDKDILANGYHLPFKDQVFKEVTSYQCLSYYIHSYKEIKRVLMDNGILTMTIRKDNLSITIKKLRKLGFKVIKKEILNRDINYRIIDYWIKLRR